MTTEETNALEGEQSTEDQAQQEPLYEWSGRKLPLNEFVAEAKKMQGEYTKSRQEYRDINSKYSELMSKSEQAAKKGDDEGADVYKDAADKLTPYLMEKFEKIAEEKYQKRAQEDAAVVKFRNDLKDTEDLARNMGMEFSDEVKERLISHMSEEGIGNPIKAFKDLYEEQYLDYKTQVRKSGTKKLYTETGAKPPTSKGGVYDKKIKDITDQGFQAYLAAKLEATQ